MLLRSIRRWVKIIQPDATQGFIQHFTLHILPFLAGIVMIRALITSNFLHLIIPNSREQTYDKWNNYDEIYIILKSGTQPVAKYLSTLDEKQRNMLRNQLSVHSDAYCFVFLNSFQVFYCLKAIWHLGHTWIFIPFKEACEFLEDVDIYDDEEQQDMFIEIEDSLSTLMYLGRTTLPSWKFGTIRLTLLKATVEILTIVWIICEMMLIWEVFNYDVFGYGFQFLFDWLSSYPNEIEVDSLCTDCSDIPNQSFWRQSGMFAVISLCIDNDCQLQSDFNEKFTTFLWYILTASLILSIYQFINTIREDYDPSYSKMILSTEVECYFDVYQKYYLTRDARLVLSQFQKLSKVDANRVEKIMIAEYLKTFEEETDESDDSDESDDTTE